MSRHRAILIILAVFFVLGALTNNFGESWDDLSLQKYANKSLNAYQTWFQKGEVNIAQEDLGYYGPSYIMTVALLSNSPDQRHLIYFITFLAGAAAFYALSLRWISQHAAISATLLYLTQPLLWGHAFINPKDTPFLSLFLLSLYFGLKIFDPPDLIRLNELNPRSKRILALLSSSWLILTLGLFLFTDAFHLLIENLVLNAKSGEVNIISLLASDLAKVDAAIYIQRYFVLFLRARSAIFVFSSLFLLFLLSRASPSTFHFLLSTLLPSIILGYTTSLRILAPFAIFFIAFYAFQRHRKNAIIPLTIYALSTSIAIYLTWPYLWKNPLPRFIESFIEMSRYPWTGLVLFNGAEYSATNLPITYLPVLLRLQLTEPVWVLAMIGLFVGIFGSREKRGLIALCAIWFLIPLIGFIAAKITLYDNFRQIFFILPPVFMLAGAAFEKIENKKWMTAAIILCILPGIISIIRLHPYEYVYYNSFASDVFRKYELDYWGTSYREAAEFLNKTAPEGAAVWVDGPSHLFDMFARTDLKIYSDHETERAKTYNFIVSTTRYDLDLSSYPDAQVIYRVEKHNGVYAVIKKP